jgi:hypothetical protein
MVLRGQTLAVGNQDYRRIIEKDLVSSVRLKLPCLLVLVTSVINLEHQLFCRLLFQGIPCLYGPAVEELMWGLKFQMRKLVPAENPELINEDRLPMSAGMQCFLNFHGFEVKPDMMVSPSIITSFPICVASKCLLLYWSLCLISTDQSICNKFFCCADTKFVSTVKYR